MTQLLLPPDEPQADLSRRLFLKAGAAAALFQLTPLQALADNSFWDQPRQLRLYRAQTKESLDVVYFRDGQIDYDGYYKVCQLLRDTHENKAVQMDPVLLDVLCGVQGYYRAYGYNYPLVINSGFRTLKTNNSLLSEGAAKNSMHLYGKAADLSMPHITPRHLGLVGLYFRQGGVGFYERSGFVHLDTGRLRVWRR